MCTEKSFSKNCLQVPRYAKKEQSESSGDAENLKWLMRDLENENFQ